MDKNGKNDGHEVKEPYGAYISGSEAGTLDEATASRIGRYADRVKYPRQGEYTMHDFLELDDGTLADLIDGVIYDRGAPSIVHQEIVLTLARRFADFIDDNHGSCHVWTDTVDVQLDPKDEKTFIQPDILVLCDKNKIKNGGEWISGAPDLIVEVLSKSTRTNDLGRKLWKYHDSGVREYWIIDPDKESIIIYRFEQDEVDTYDFKDRIPVRIWDGYLVIDFSEIKERIDRLR